jgi:hypothetical protein
VRRALALLGFFAVLFLALALLYRVYLHHTAAEPYVEERTSVVQIGEKFSRHLG